MDYIKSKCKGPWLHRWKLLRATDQWQEEVCEICHDRLFTPSRQGRIDNHKYLQTHLRSALQPYMPRFSKEYPLFVRSRTR